MLVLENVRSGYGDSEVLHGISVNVPVRKVTILIGPNGAGKSTLLKSIMNIVRSSSGRIRLDGTDITGASTQEILKKGVSYVSQGAGIFPNMTVMENLLMGGYLRKGREWRSKIDEAVAMFPILREREGQKAGFLSGGERQMLAIARSLVTSPKLLLLDEPSLGLDIGKQKLILDKLKELNSQGFTILLAEQNLTAARIADQAYVLNQGKIKYEGSPSVFQDSAMTSRLFFGIGEGKA